MVPIGGRPILIHIMECFSRFGFKDFILCLGYREEIIRNYFSNFTALTSDFTVDLNTGVIHRESDVRYDWKVTLASTGIPTGTGGRIKRVARYLEDESFLMTYGDGLADLNLKKLLKHHRSSGCLATVTGVRGTSRFGVIETRGSGKVDGFREKPLLEGMVSGGFFVFEPGIMDYLTRDCVLEKEPLERLAREGKLALFPHDGFFMSMDTYRDYLQLNEMYDAGHTPWITP
jgi:glucose-1-phosphate cytidylyltransferase